MLVRAWRRANSTSPPSSAGIPQQFCRGHLTSQLFLVSTATAAGQLPGCSSSRNRSETARPSRPVLQVPAQWIALEPRPQALSGQVGKQLVAMNPEHLLHYRAPKFLAASQLASAGARPPIFPSRSGFPSAFSRRPIPCSLARTAFGAHHQAREIKLELVPIARSVGTLHLAQFPTVAEIDDAPGLLVGKIADVFAFLVNCVEQRREGGTQVEAKPATLADVVNALEFLGESRPLPVLGFNRTVGKTLGRLGFNSISRHQQQTACGRWIGGGAKENSGAASRSGISALRLGQGPSGLGKAAGV